MFFCIVCEIRAFTLKKISGVVHSFVQKHVFGLFWTERPSSRAMSRDSLLKIDQIEDTMSGAGALLVETISIVMYRVAHVLVIF
jgi:hypothetical protein